MSLCELVRSDCGCWPRVSAARGSLGAVFLSDGGLTTPVKDGRDGRTSGVQGLDHGN